jgi:hypothetical protein
MLPYSAGMAAIDYAGYSSAPMGTLGINVGNTSITHSWLVPTQDLCAVPYKQQNQQIEPGHVLFARKNYA